MTTIPEDPKLFHTRASAAFGEQLVALQAQDSELWLAPTPCDGWDVRTLVAHVVLAEAQIPPLVAGESPEPIDEIDVSILGPDPVASWRGTALASIAAVRDADLDARVAHPIGRITIRHALGFRVSDNLVHAWDLSVVRGDPVDLDAEIAQWCLDFWLPLADQLVDSGYFAAMTEPVDESAGARLLALLGRTPPT